MSVSLISTLSEAMSTVGGFMGRGTKRLERELEETTEERKWESNMITQQSREWSEFWLWRTV